MAFKCWNIKLMFQRRLTLLPVFVTSDGCSKSWLWLYCSVFIGIEVLVQSQSAGEHRGPPPSQMRQVLCCPSLYTLWGFLQDQFLQNGSSGLWARLSKLGGFSNGSTGIPAFQQLGLLWSETQMEGLLVFHHGSHDFFKNYCSENNGTLSPHNLF